MSLIRAITIAAVAVIAFGVAAVFVARTYLSGDRIVWSDAYVALDAAELHRSPNAAEHERLLLANAMAESEAPEGMPAGRRIHPIGTLVRLRYEVLDDAGGVADTVDVRAIVPALPYFGADAPAAPFGTTGCPRACQQQRAAAQATLIDRTGQAGLADEWLLRMPVGQPFPLGKRSLTVRDFQSAAPYSIPLASVRVTMIEACNGRLRAGAATHLEFFPFAIVPIPSGLRTDRWVQFEGCGQLVAAVPAARVATAAEPDPNTVDEEVAPPGKELRRRIPPSAAGLEALVPEDEGQPLGRALLVVNESWLTGHGRPQRVHVVRACRYDGNMNQWRAIPLPDGDLEIALPQSVPGDGRSPRRVAMRLPEGPALFWAEWTEADLDQPRAGRLHSVSLESGRKPQCPRTVRRAAAPDEIVACVPNHATGEVRAVPDPATYCTGPEASASVAN